jgi:hypothetical protein
LYPDGKNRAIRQPSANWRITHFIDGTLAAIIAAKWGQINNIMRLKKFLLSIIYSEAS